MRNFCCHLQVFTFKSQNMSFTVNVLLTCILNCNAGPGYDLELFASTVDRFLPLVSYLPFDPTFFFTDTVALL